MVQGVTVGVTQMEAAGPRRIAEGVHVVEAPQGFLGLEVGARMTILQLEGGLLVHSPLQVKPASLEALGAPRWVLAPNLFHHLYVGGWMEAGWEGWAAPGLPQKRQDLDFQGVIQPGQQPFGEEVEVLPLRCFPMANEVVLLHRPSRSLLVTDLVFNLPPTAPWPTRAAMRCLLGYPGCQTTLLERVAMRRDAARQELHQILSWDFDRVIMAHGQVIEAEGKAALRHAFRWLLPAR